MCSIFVWSFPLLRSSAVLPVLVSLALLTSKKWNIYVLCHSFLHALIASCTYVGRINCSENICAMTGHKRWIFNRRLQQCSFTYLRYLCFHHILYRFICVSSFASLLEDMIAMMLQYLRLCEAAPGLKSHWVTQVSDTYTMEVSWFVIIVLYRNTSLTEHCTE